MKMILASGKRKSAIARALVKPGRGRIRINGAPLEIVEPELARWKIMEPILLAGEEVVKQLDIDVDVEGGGVMGQATASRIAVARALYEWTGNEELRKIYLEYDRGMLSGDPRRPEPKKPRGRSARAKRQKSYR